jgi:hypothetical protein
VGICTLHELPDFVERLLPNRVVYEPSAARHALYRELFELYLSLSTKLRQDFAGLAGVVQRNHLDD